MDCPPGSRPSPSGYALNTISAAIFYRADLRQLLVDPGVCYWFQTISYWEPSVLTASSPRPSRLGVKILDIRMPSS